MLPRTTGSRLRLALFDMHLAQMLLRGAACLLLATFSLPVTPDGLETLVMPGKVIQGHADVESNCKKCHVPFDKSAQSKLCLGCHDKIAADRATRTGYHGRLDAGRACNECHTDHKGRKAKIVDLDPAHFDHSLADFVLLGLHAGVKCGDCHAAGRKFRDAPKTCVGCHRKDDVHKGKLGISCEGCHDANSWKRGKFDHTKTGFPLRSSHATVACRDCHKTPTFHDQPSRLCVGCHRKDDVHKGRFGTKCETCHAESKWNLVRFDHERDAHFALRDAHRSVKCDGCHKGPLYQAKLPTTCNGCHQKDDVHKGRFGADCKSCHTEIRWKTARFDHDRDTKFMLRDTHRSVKCDACHTPALKTQQPPTTCNGCHAKQDVHRGALGERCDSCHLETRWKATRFDHAKNTRYPLLGMHGKVQCKACHADNTFRQKLKTDCISCHRKDDAHKGKLGATCNTCHNARDWRIWDFDHHKRAGFLLDGAHDKIACVSCHTRPGDKVYTAGARCVDCHDRDDVHHGGFGQDCGRCHLTSTFGELRSSAASRAR